MLHGPVPVEITREPNRRDYRLIADLVLKLEKSRIDSATGVFNKNTFMEDLGRVLDRSEFGQSNVALAFIDICYLKAMNDKHTHTMGDYYLNTTVRLLEQLVRPTDKIYRFGGDELTVIMSGIEPLDLTDASISCQFIEDRLEKQIGVGLQQDELLMSTGIPVWASVGVAFYDHLEISTDFTKRADARMQIRKDQYKESIGSLKGYHDNRL